MLILVTGATGVVGREVVAHLLAAGHTVRALVRSLPDAQALLPPTADLAEGSLEDPLALARALEGCQACVHLAGLVRFDRGAQRDLLHTNHQGTALVVSTCSQTPGLLHLVHISSVAALPEAKADARSIPTPGMFTGYYGYTKRLAELEVERGGAEGLPFTILRPALVLAGHPAGRSSAAVYRVARRPRTVAPPGAVSWVAGADVARAVAGALAAGPEGRSYTLCAGQSRWIDLINTYRSQHHIQGHVWPVPAWAMRLASRVAWLVGPLLSLSIPGPRQVENMLHPRTYPEAPQAEALLGGPYLSLEQALSQPI